jgi:uncharacterized protein involved in outer membrane biogenesis
MPRLILIPLILVALLVLAAIVLVPLFLDEEKVLEIASTQLREQTGATLTVGGDTSRCWAFPCSRPLSPCRVRSKPVSARGPCR